MKGNNSLLEFDDTEAILFISKYLEKLSAPTVSHDDIQYILDLIYDFYEQNNLISEDENIENASIDENEMFEYIRRIVKKEKIIEMDDDTIAIILDGEYEYGKTIGIYTEE